MKKISLILTASVICLASSSYAGIDSKLPQIVSGEWKSIEKVGEARFSKFGLHIYDASFWSLRTSKSLEQTSSATALSISYARNIKAKRLLSSTYQEWKRLGFAQKHPLDAWLASLEKIWPDVEKGDFLVFVATKDGDNLFFSSNKILGRINDPEFGSAFLDIWLGINAKYQTHREELLGEKN